MIINVLKNILLITIVATFQISFIANSKWPVFLIELILVSVLLISELKSYESALILAIIMGSVYDLFSPIFFLSSVLCLIITLFIVRKLSLKFFTNRSIYSIIILTIIGTSIYKIAYSLMFFIDNLIAFKEVPFYLIMNNSYWSQLFVAAFVNTFIAGIIYLLTVKFMHNFSHPSIVDTKK
jgi:hypothetical protein